MLVPRKEKTKKSHETDHGEIDREREDDKRHDPEHCLHGSQVGIVDTRLCTQLQRGKY